MDLGGGQSARELVESRYVSNAGLGSVDWLRFFGDLFASLIVALAVLPMRALLSVGSAAAGLFDATTEFVVAFVSGLFASPAATLREGWTSVADLTSVLGPTAPVLVVAVAIAAFYLYVKGVNWSA